MIKEILMILKMVYNFKKKIQSGEMKLEDTKKL